ncbi:Tetratricopeptide repeat-containing protein [Polaribacter sp. KT25b]|uniref:tetratricopeptide repeat-containing sensor histidine kinase n=1 Tax=Polaribacter sp. KT25b TaxID=1855336 RepID=UPI0008797A30|nr:histidine kinase [Polaribacter sp. KT25b]SDR67799.1 Tetratricopeptide repeat-containing protein [Polaribacter sp. KT25b]
MTKKIYIIFILLFGVLTNVFSQVNIINQKGTDFFVRITIVDKHNIKIVKNIDIEVNGMYYSLPDVNGRFIVKAKVGDEIRVSHPDFETVYYTLTSSEDIKIIVENYENKRSISSKLKTVSKETDFYLGHLDSAKFYKKKDIEKSLSFIEKALKNKENTKRNAATYKLLADVYLYWKQFDLAVYNYKLSYQINKEINTKIALANAQFLLNNFDESKQTYQELSKEKLSIYERIQIFEGLGDVFFKTKIFETSIINYQKALQVAKDNLITPKITDLNSKIADVFAAQGKINKAETLFKNSLNLAEKENPKRALEEEEKVADFYNSNRRFDDEIQLRKKSLIKAEENEASKRKSIEKDSITSQKINYKIGNAYLLKEDYKEAIPFLQKSIKGANDKEDIVVQKEATRKLSEAYVTVGDYNNALKSYQEYVELVDELYIKKEQEIQQVKRFSKKIADNQNRIASLEKDQELAQSKISLAYVDQKLSEESNQRQRIIIYALFGGILLLSLLAYFMFRNNKQQKLANNLLALKSMRSQMNPHFIFNALNSVNSFIAVNDERNANRYLSEFSVLMRAVLENSDEDFIPLTKEIELLELYVKLEHNRFKEKFDYQINIDKTIDLEQFSIPPMLLQPYIENAIWHGLRYRTTKGNLEISINRKDDETILISIIDNGIGRKKSQELKTKNQLKQKSKGMSTIKNRITILNNMYKDRISVNVADVLENGEGTKVALLLKKK